MQRPYCRATWASAQCVCSAPGADIYYPLEAKQEIERNESLLAVAKGLLVSLDGSLTHGEAMAALKALPAQVALAHIVDCTIGLCLRLGTQTQGVEEQAKHAMWFTISDHLLRERQALRSPTSYSTTSELVGLMVVTQLKKLLEQMKAVVGTTEITRNIFGESTKEAHSCQTLKMSCSAC